MVVGLGPAYPCLQKGSIQKLNFMGLNYKLSN